MPDVITAVLGFFFYPEHSLNVKYLKIEWRWMGQFADDELE